MLHINERTMKECISVKEIIDQIDLSYELYESDTFEMPTRSQMKQDNNTLILMPCYVNDIIATKLVTVFPNNKQNNDPTIHALMVLKCRETGKMKATLDGTYLTATRTGAVGGSAVRHLAQQNAQTIAVIGSGVQGLHQTIAACEEREITDIYIYNRTQEKIPPFKKELSEVIGKDIKLHATTSAEEAIKNAQIVITATTSEEPVLPNDSALLKGRLFVGIGSYQPSMREFPEALYDVGTKIYVDSTDAIKESGDVISPLEKGWFSSENVETLSSAINKNNLQKNYEDGESIIFKSTGMALFDAVVANAMYEAVIENDLGIDIM